MRTIAIGLALAALAGRALAEPPANLKPKAIAGPGWNVTDLEGMKAWYVDKLGMRLVNTISREGKPYEYILGYEAPGGPILALLASAQRPAGPNRFARLILTVPDAKGLAEHLKGQGVASREVIANVAYFITDPEGNAVELYTPPAR